MTPAFGGASPVWRVQGAEWAGQGPDWNQTWQGGAVNVFLLPVLRNLCHTHSIILAGAVSLSCLWFWAFQCNEQPLWGSPEPPPDPGLSRPHPIMA